MANTYSQLPIQIVFAIKDPLQCPIKEVNRIKIEKYICGIISNYKCKPLAIYCNPDHTHILVGLHPAIAISDLVRNIKAASSKYIHQEVDYNNHFAWQDGFGVFSYSRSQVAIVVAYILNQPEHHKKRVFKEEYLEMLKKAEIEYNEKYVFD